MTLVETANSAILPVVRNKQAQIGCSTEPFVTQGVRSRRLGRAVHQHSEDAGSLCVFDLQCAAGFDQEDSRTGANGFVRGMMKSLKFVDRNHDEAAEIAKKQFPTMALDDLKATLDRSFADELWSKDGTVSRASWDTAKAVVMGAGILKVDVKYDEIIDMSYVDKFKASL